MAAAPHYKKTRGLINIDALAVGGAHTGSEARYVE